MTSSSHEGTIAISKTPRKRTRSTIRSRTSVACSPNDLDRYHLVIDVIDRVPGLADRAGHLGQEMEDTRLRARAYGREHGEDDPDIAGWSWQPQAAETP